MSKTKEELNKLKEEIEEQKILREKYLESFRANLKAQLENIEIVDPDDPRLKRKKN